MAPPANSVEGNIIVLVQWLKLAVESFGAGLVAVGVGVAIVQLVRTLAGKQPAEFNGYSFDPRALSRAGSGVRAWRRHPRHGYLSHMGSDRQTRRRRGHPHGPEFLPLDGNETRENAGRWRGRDHRPVIEALV